jgi:hypothetical protein
VQGDEEVTGYHEVRSFLVPLSELDKGWAAPENFKPFACEIDFDESEATIVCRKWHRGEDRERAAWADADHAETIEAHEWPIRPEA